MSGAVDARTYGASPSASGAVNTAAIQAALNQHSWVTITQPGTYLIAAGTDATATSLMTCLYLSSNNRLSLAPGVVIKLADDQDCYMLRNVASATDMIVEGGRWDGNAGNQTEVEGWEGDMVWFRNCSRVMVRDMVMTGGLKYCLLFGAATHWTAQDIYFDDTGSDGIHLHGDVSHFVIRNMRGTSRDNFVALVTSEGTYRDSDNYDEGDITDGLIEGLFVEDCFEPVRLTGKTDQTIARVTIRHLRGSVSTGYGLSIRRDAVGGLTGPTVQDVTIEDVCYTSLPSANPSTNLLIFLDSPGIKSLTIRDVVMLTNNPIIYRSGVVNMERLTIERVRSKGAWTVNQITLLGSQEQLVINNLCLETTDTTTNSVGVEVLESGNTISIRDYTFAHGSTTNGRAFRIGASGSVTSLTVDGLRMTNGLYGVQIDGTATEARLVNCHAVYGGTSAAMFAVTSSTATVGRAIIANSRQEGGIGLVRTSTNNAWTLETADCYVSGVSQCLYSATDVTWRISNVTLNNVPQVATVFGVSARTLRMTGRGLHRTGTGTTTVFASVGSWSANVPDMRCDIQASGSSNKPTPQEGDCLYNTNTSLSGVSAAGRVIYANGAWQKHGWS